MVNSSHSQRAPSSERYEATLQDAIADLVAAVNERDTVRTRLNRLDDHVSALTDLARDLIKVLPAERRPAYLQQLSKLSGTAAPQPRAGTTYDNVIQLMQLHKPEERWTVPKIQTELSRLGTDEEAKPIYNVLNYLARTGRLRRIARGMYVVKDLGVVFQTAEEIDGLEPTADYGDMY